MKLFNFISNNSAKIPPSDEPLMNLGIGNKFNYDAKTWKVTEVHEYDWGGGILSYTYLIQHGKEELFLDVETDNGLSLELFELPIALSHVNEDIPQIYRTTNTLPDTLNCQNELFKRKLSCTGTVSSQPALIKRTKPVLSYHYESSTGRLLAVQFFDNKEFELSLGKKIKASEISEL